MFRKILKISGFVLLGIIVIAALLLAVYYPSAKRLFFGREIIQQDSLLTLYLGGGGNSAILNSDSAVLVIDTKMGKAADQLYQQVKDLAGDKPVIVVNTHSDLDHTGGNPLYKKATIISGKVDENYWILTNGKEGMPSVWLTDTMNLKLGDETVTLINMGQAHTWCDIIAYFHKRKLLVSGDLIFNRINTFLDAKKGSNGAKSIDVLKRMNKLPEIKVVLPGHGETGGRELITDMQTYLEDMSLAARNRDLQKAMEQKYKKWVSMPGVSSPAIIIDYFRKHL
jgi:glyoxylase-like metal-dependent hydrolase (beta-lactamase superfamily II)